ncbi:MAG: DUF4386 domain-containing protein [Spirochaetales bacterium]|nr:DUF4386 domain-containing protein [Spirochaetales bacterium]
MTFLHSKESIRLPGILYLLLAVTGFFSSFSLNSFSISQFDLWIPYLDNHQYFFTAGLLSYASMIMVWLLLAWNFYNRFRQVDRTTSGLLLLFVIVGAGMEFTILMLKSVPLIMISMKDIIATELFSSWMKWAHFLFIMAGKVHKVINLFYALWLFPLSYLYYQWTEKKKISVILSAALMICAMGYLCDFFLFYLFPDSVTIEITDFTFIGEVVLLIWLLIKGQKTLTGSKNIERD